MPDENSMIQVENSLDLKHLLKLRLAVARFGEMDRQGWWNTKGMLGNLGKTVLSRGFPQTHFLAQARVAFAVAATRCAEVFSPPGHFTLWSLPAAVEDAFQEQWMDWRDESSTFQPFFDELASDNSPDLLASLTKLKLIDEPVADRVKTLRVASSGNAILIPGNHKLDHRILNLLAAGFARGGKGQLVIPYVALEGGA